MTSVADTAIERHQSYLQQDPTNIPLNMQLGDLYEQARLFEQAAACYHRCLQLRPGHPPARSRLAGLLMTRHRFAEAEAMLRTLMAEGDTAVELRHNLGLALYFQQRWSETGQCFAELAARGGCSADGFGYWARSLRQLNDFAGAIGAARQWLAAAADMQTSQTAKSYLAQLLFDGGQEAEGCGLARQVLAAWPDDGGAHAVLGMAAIARHDAAAAVRHFDRTIAGDPEDPRGWQGLGLARFHQQDMVGAIAALQRAVSLSPKALGSLMALGWAKLLSGDFAGAEQVFTGALDVDRNFGESHGGLAAALALQGKATQAEREARLARRLGPGGFGVDFADAALLAAQGRRESADDLIAQALRRSLPGGGTLLDHLRAHAQRQAGALH